MMDEYLSEALSCSAGRVRARMGEDHQIAVEVKNRNCFLSQCLSLLIWFAFHTVANTVQIQAAMSTTSRVCEEGSRAGISLSS
jgi:hypothetical protein